MSTRIWKGCLPGEKRLWRALSCAQHILVVAMACAVILLAVGCTRLGASDAGDPSAATSSPAIPAEGSPTRAETPTLTAEPPASPVPLFTPEPLPEYLWAVFPEPGRSLSVAQHLEESQPYLFPDRRVMTQVCLSVSIQPLMDRGDSFDNVSQWLPRLQLTIDGNLQGRPVIAFTSDLYLGLQAIRRPGSFCFRFRRESRQWLCYDFEFTAGSHILESAISRRSGAVERYRWWFILTED